MKDEGYVKAYRKIWHDPSFKNLLEAGMWNYLYQSAMWRDGVITMKGHHISLKRGQLFTSPRFLAKGFQTTEKTIRKFLSGLEDRKEIVMSTTNRGTTITICNYERYASGKKAGRTEYRTEGQPDGQAQLFENNEFDPSRENLPGAPEGKQKAQIKNEGDNEGDNTLLSGRVSKHEYTQEFEKGWSVYRKTPTMSKSKSFASWEKALKKGIIAPDLIAAIEAFNRYMDEQGRNDPNFVPHMTTWLNEERYNGFLAAAKDAQVTADKNKIDPATLSPQRKLIFDAMGNNLFVAWFLDAEIEEQPSEGKGARCFTMRLKTKFQADYIRQEYRERLISAFSAKLKSKVDLFFEVKK